MLRSPACTTGPARSVTPRATRDASAAPTSARGTDCLKQNQRNGTESARGTYCLKQNQRKGLRKPAPGAQVTSSYDERPAPQGWGHTPAPQARLAASRRERLQSQHGSPRPPQTYLRKRSHNSCIAKSGNELVQQATCTTESKGLGFTHDLCLPTHACIVGSGNRPAHGAARTSRSDPPAWV